MIQTHSENKNAGVHSLILSLVWCNVLNTNDLDVDLREGGRFDRILVLNAKILC
jgi:hypothetical protein